MNWIAALDNTELRIAENYLSKAEFSAALERVEQHMIRQVSKTNSISCDNHKKLITY